MRELLVNINSFCLNSPISSPGEMKNDKYDDDDDDDDSCYVYGDYRCGDDDILCLF